METQPTSKPISKGICAFCKTEVAKNKMTQHLKFCKQRLASIASEEAKSQETKTRLFHILAEGRYSPEYWLHFEVPAYESLWSLDDFLKDMWIDDLDHLSGFTINGTDYSTDYPGDYFVFAGEEEAKEGDEEEEDEEEEKELTEEEQRAELAEVIEEVLSEYVGKDGLFGLNFRGEDLLPTEWIAGIKQPRSVYELINYLKEELARIEKEQRHARRLEKEMPQEESRRLYFAAQCQKFIVESILEEIEDRTMEVALEHVLKVGQKFSYIYDYGSSTYINLKVIAEREGIVQEGEDTVKQLARNTAPVFACTVCGKPATMVAMGYYYGGIEENVYCDTCAEEQVEEGRTLPIINSPRVGVL